MRRPRRQRISRALPLVAGACVYALVTGCVYPTLIHDHDLMVLAIQPADSAAAVPTSILPTFWFTRELGDEMPFTVVLHGGGETRQLDACRSTDSGEVLQCPLDVPLADNVLYELTIDLADDGEIDGTSLFTTGMPQGLSYDVGQDLVVSQAGDSEFAAGLFQEALVGGDSTMLMSLDLHPGTDELPWSGSFLIGQGHVKPQACNDGEVVVDGEYGFTISAEGNVQADGGFMAHTDFATLPVEINDETFYVVVRDVVIRGELDVDDGLQTVPQVTLDGLVPMSSMEEIGEAFPDWAELVAELVSAIDPDVDIDGDGTNDACSLSISAEGTRVTLVEAKDH